MRTVLRWDSPWTLGAAIGVVTLVACWILASCSGAATRAPEPDPAAALEAYHRALEEGRVLDAFALIHPEAREGMDAKAFAALYARHRDALVEQAAQLVARARSAPAHQRAWVSDGSTTSELVRTQRGWRLSWPVGEPLQRQHP